MRVTFIVADRNVTRIAAIYENECVPYRRRAVTIELTPEQAAAVAVREVGMENGSKIYEEILSCFVENEPQEEQSHD